MDETAKAKDLAEQVATARQVGELSHEPVEGWPDSLGVSSGLTPYELGLLHSQMMGHRWHAWRCLNGGGEEYFVACSCGWRSFQANSLAPVLGQVKDHLEGVRVSHGYRRSPWAAQAPAPGQLSSGAGQREMPPAERARELHAFVLGQQERLRQALERSVDLLSASEDQADRRVAELEYAAAHMSPERARTRASAQWAEGVQSQLERGKELRKGVVAAAAALAAMAEEVAWINQDLQSCHPSGAAEHQRRADEARKSAAQAREVEHAFSD